MQPPTRVIGILSGKGGVGKTTTSANLSVALSELNHRTLAVDGNLAFPNLALHFGILNVPADLQNVLEEKLDVEDVAIRYRDSKLKILQTSLRYKNTSYDNLAKVIQSVLDYDYVLLDCAPGGYMDPMKAFLASCTDVLLITTPDYPSASAVAKIARMAREQKVRVLGVILNRVQNKKFELSKADIQKILDEKVICSIPEDPMVPESISARMPVVAYAPTSPAGRKYLELARFIAAEAPMPEETFFEKIINWLKRLF